MDRQNRIELKKQKVAIAQTRLKNHVAHMRENYGCPTCQIQPDIDKYFYHRSRLIAAEKLYLEALNEEDKNHPAGVKVHLEWVPLPQRPTRKRATRGDEKLVSNQEADADNKPVDRGENTCSVMGDLMSVKEPQDEQENGHSKIDKSRYKPPSGDEKEQRLEDNLQDRDPPENYMENGPPPIADVSLRGFKAPSDVSKDKIPNKIVQ